MLDSLVRVSRRVLRVPKAVASPTGIRPPYGPPRGAGGTFAGLSKVSRATNSGPGPVTALGPCDTSVYRGARLRRPRRMPLRRRRACPRDRRDPVAGARGRGMRCARARVKGLRPDTLRVPPGSRPGDRGFDACRFTVRRVGRRTRAVDRHPAGRDVLLGEKCTTTKAPDIGARRRARARAARAPRGIAHRREASVVDDESPRSIFWVS